MSDALRAIAEAYVPKIVRHEYGSGFGDWHVIEDIRKELNAIRNLIAALEASCLCGSCVRKRGGGQHHNGPCAVDKERFTNPDGTSRQAFLRKRLRELEEQP